MDLHVLAKRRRVGVALVAAVNLAVVGFVARVDVRVLLTVGTVGETTITSLELTAEWLLSYISTTDAKQSSTQLSHIHKSCTADDLFFSRLACKHIAYMYSIASYGGRGTQCLKYSKT